MTPADLEQAELVEMALYGAGTGYEKTLAVEVLRLRTVVERLEKVEAAARAVRGEWVDPGQREYVGYGLHDAGVLDVRAPRRAETARRQVVDLHGVRC